MNADHPNEVNKSRPVLGELTNQLGKRGFSLVSQNPASKPDTGKQINLKNDRYSHLKKKVVLQPEASVKEQSSANKSLKISNTEMLPTLRGGKTYRLLSLGNSLELVPDENFEPGKQSKTSEGELAVDGAERFSNEAGEKNSRNHSPKLQDERLLEVLGSQASSNEGNKPCFDSSTSSKCPQSVGSILASSQEEKSFEVERCRNLKCADGDSGSRSCADLLKNCSCSYCRTAAYMWSELNYLDVRARLSALTKSKKEVSNMVRKCSKDNEISRGRETLNRASKLESELKTKWKSLFLNTEEALVRECHQLETNMTELKGIRENCKINLGMMKEMPSDAPHCPSGASANLKKI